MTKTGRIVYSTHSNAARIYANILSEELGIGFSDFKIHKDDVRTTENVVYNNVKYLITAVVCISCEPSCRNIKNLAQTGRGKHKT